MTANQQREFLKRGLMILTVLSFTSCNQGGGGDDGGGPPGPPAPAIDLPRTGQVVSADANAVQRDDGSLEMGVAWPNPRFTDNGDGTVLDNLTGLVWLKDANCMQTNDPTYDNDVTQGDGAVFWSNALQFMSSLPGSNCGGAYNDWRLPNIRELRSLLDYSRSSPMLPAGHPFLNVQSTASVYYWSSTTDGATGTKLEINMGNGLHGLAIANTDNYVWPVRAGLTTAPAAVPKTGQTTADSPGDDGAYRWGVAWPNPRFTTNGDTTVRDNLTGLIWAPDGNLMPTRDTSFDTDGTLNDGMVTWQHALNYVVMLNSQSYLGFSDWRLPNVNEFDSLEHLGYASQSCGGPPCATPEAWLNTQGFSNVHSIRSSYWSSTSWAQNLGNFAWNFHSYAGKASNYFVWPVRGG